MDCLDVQRGTCIILFLIFGARNIGTPINLSTPRLHDVWFYSCCFSKHTHRCSAGFSLCCNTGHPSHVLILFHKYHPVASALSDFILTSFPVSQTLKAPSLCLLLLLPPPFTTCFHSTQPVWRCWENPPSHTHTVPATRAWNLHRGLFCLCIHKSTKTHWEEWISHVCCHQDHQRPRTINTSTTTNRFQERIGM